MKLVVGLGNPGRQYAETRHNVGFKVIEKLARRWATGTRRERFGGEVVEAEYGSHRLLLLEPLTYMNRSGESVQQARDFYKLEQADLLVICDDFSLPLGTLRVRTKGSSGGQKGLEDIIRRLGNDGFPRLRIGIGAPPPQWDAADFVLSKFSKEEQSTIDQALDRAAEAVSVWLTAGIQTCMNQYNRAADAPQGPSSGNSSACS